MFITPPPSPRFATRAPVALTTGTGTNAQNLFSTTGYVHVIALYCEVTTALAGAATCAMTIQPAFTRTGVGAVQLGPASTSINVAAGVAAKQMGGLNAAAFLPLSISGAVPVDPTMQFVLGAGIISGSTTVTGANLTAGALQWSIAYELYSADASLTVL